MPKYLTAITYGGDGYYYNYRGYVYGPFRTRNEAVADISWKLHPYVPLSSSPRENIREDLEGQAYGFEAGKR